jgi:hypothetical protein
LTRSSEPTIAFPIKDEDELWILVGVLRREIRSNPPGSRAAIVAAEVLEKLRVAANIYGMPWPEPS